MTPPRPESPGPREGPPLPAELAPMLARSAEGPLDSPDHAYEVKWDGMRVLVGLDGSRLSLRTRNRIEAAPRFPELETIREAVRFPRCVLDGEIVRVVEGRPSFAALQRRIQLSSPGEVARLAAAEPAALILFDLLRAEEEWLTDRPWEERRRRLEEAVAAGSTIQISPVWADGRALWESVSALSLEGVMAKRRGGRYTPGKRTADWLKIKRSHTLEAVVAGWTEGSGERASSFGALVLGLPSEEGLRYVGHVGTGFDQASLAEAKRLLLPLASPRCPFPGPPASAARPHWVRPEWVCEVRHSGWTPEGRLRFPVFLRWRPDRSPADCDPFDGSPS